MRSRWFSWKSLFAGVVLLSVAGLVIAFAVVHLGESEGDEGNEVAEALEHNPGLMNNRQLPIAYVAEKLSGDGEASSEILNGPSQEAYDARAYPRDYISAAQQLGAASAFANADQRAQTAEGQKVLQSAQGTAATRMWMELGPHGGVQAAETTYTGTRTIVSGRTTAMAIAGDSCTATSCTLYLGTAGGGLWRTASARSATPRWRSIGHSIPSTAIGSVYIAPNGDVYVGTGESNGSSDNEAGVGLYKSTDDGATFAKVPTYVNTKDFTLNRGVSSVAVDPTDPQHIYVGTAVARHGSSSVNGGRFTPPGAVKVGVYESTDGGQSWQKSLAEGTDSVDPTSPNGADFFRGGISKIDFDPTHAGTVYASMFDYGLYRRVGIRELEADLLDPSPGVRGDHFDQPGRVRVGSSGQRQDPDLPGRLDVLRRRDGRSAADRQRNGVHPIMGLALDRPGRAARVRVLQLL